MSAPAPNVRQAVPFFGIADMTAALHFYVDGLGFTMTQHWLDNGKLRWCRLELDDAALMLQEFLADGHGPGRPAGTLGLGVTICFICDDALAIYHAARARGLTPSLPFVGNGMWVTSLSDSDGYRLDFESITDVPEGTEYQEAQ